jgi:homocitrate synthase NifV
MGRKHQFILGKHSGSQGVMHAYQQVGISVSRLQANLLLPMIRQFASLHKRAPQFNDLNQFLYLL